MSEVFREINIGRVTGLSSYELAVKNGAFEGTEQEYVDKEQKVYNDIVNLKKDFDESLSSIQGAINNVGLRMNYLGYITEQSIIDAIFDTYLADETVVKDKSGGFSYTFNSEDGMYIGFEKSKVYGVQARLSWLHGLDIRTKNNLDAWSDWDSCILQSDNSIQK